MNYYVDDREEITPTGLTRDTAEESDELAVSGLTRNKAGGQSPGEILREARLAHDYSIDDLCAQTRLSRRIVHALEDDDFDTLAQPVFARGYYRQCAKVLDIDSDRLMAAYAAAGGERASRPASPQRVAVVPADVTPGRRRPFGLIVLVLLALLVLGALFVLAPDAQFSGDADADSADDSTVVLTGDANDSGIDTDDIGDSSGGDRAADASEAPATAEPTRADRTDTAANSAGAAADTPAANSGPRAGGRNVSESLGESDAGASEQLTPAPAEAPTVDPAHLKLTFTGRSWVDVRDADGSRLLTGIFENGTTREFDGKPPYKITLGYAPGVKIDIGGEAVDVAAQMRDNATARLTVATAVDANANAN